MINFWRYAYGLLGLVLLTFILAIVSLPDAKLHLIACDVGQGDAILAVYKNTQVLIDGGPDKKILDCLSRQMPFWDREIEAVILTHPEDDHYGGLIEVLKSYKVDNLLANAVNSEKKGYQAYKQSVADGGVRVINPTNNTSVRMGKLYLDIAWPSEGKMSEENVSGRTNVLGAFGSKKDLNTFSVVVNLTFGNFDALLPGDIGTGIIPDILAGGEIIDVEYLKVPHHGSKNGLTKALLDKATPEIAVISVGSKNRYGHPNQETLKMLTDKGIRVLRTDEVGDIEIITDGLSWWSN